MFFSLKLCAHTRYVMNYQALFIISNICSITLALHHGFWGESLTQNLKCLKNSIQTATFPKIKILHGFRIRSFEQFRSQKNVRFAVLAEIDQPDSQVFSASTFPPAQWAQQKTEPKGFQIGPPGSKRLVYPGDLCVHKRFGLCRFSNADDLQQRIEVVFADEMHTFGFGHAELLTRYKSKEQAGVNPKLSKFAAADRWELKLQKVKLKTDALARDIAFLYAQRDSMYRDPCEQDGPAFWEFEDRCTFEPTLDQKNAFEDVMKDMIWRKRPMDRLVCGDVGFGKTEVAMRAIYRAVLNGRQVALLAPTTILAAQHFRTLCERMPEVQIGLLRGGKLKENTRVKAQLEAGSLEVVIGTHSLLARSVTFKNLGLLVVDEEQRFGVSQKEKLKAASSGIDVLTLSATPIPRTLQMSLSGMRDMSTLFTPPQGRQNICTTVGRQNEALIQSAIYNELARGGQVYYVVPRVAQLEDAVKMVQSLIPDAKIMCCHGQMKEVENIIVQFTLGQADILIATSIIENGLDIPNVNTMIIQDANYFGLSALYQLRGRVGRSSKKAFAYFFHSSDRLSPEASMRLTALKQLSHLGSGYELSQRDLEIRGAGEVLGTQQSGIIGEMGFDLYIQLLEESMSELRGTTIQPTLYCKVHIEGLDKGDVPDSYMSVNNRRHELNRLRVAETKEELIGLAQQWVKNYGALPSSTKQLIKLNHLQIAGKRLGIESIQTREKDVVLASQNLQLANWEVLVEQLPEETRQYEMEFESEGSKGPEIIIEKLGLKPPEVQVNYLLGMLLHLVDYIHRTQARTTLQSNQH